MVVWIVDPAVAVIVTVDVPAGVPTDPPLELPLLLLPPELEAAPLLPEPAVEPDPPPPQPGSAKVPINNNAKSPYCPAQAMVCRRRQAIGRPIPASSSPPGSSGLSGLPCEFKAVCAVVVMVSVEVEAVPLTVTEAGEKPHAAPCGKPEQDNDTL